MDPPSVQQRVQFPLLLQLADSGAANRVTTATMVPGTAFRDMAAALERLVDDGSIDGPTWKLATLLALTENAELSLTARGKTRVNEDDI